VKKIGKKAAAAGAAGIEPRNLAKVKMQEMTPEEIQASLSFPPPARGLGYICREREGRREKEKMRGEKGRRDADRKREREREKEEGRDGRRQR